MIDNNALQGFMVSMGLSALTMLALFLLMGLISAFTVRLVAIRVVKFRPTYGSAIKAGMFGVFFIYIGALITSAILAMIVPGIFNVGGGVIILGILVVQSLCLGAYCYREPLQPPPGHNVSFAQGLLLYVVATVTAVAAATIVSAIIQVFTSA